MEAIFGMLIPISGIVGGFLLAYAGLVARNRRRQMIHDERMRAMELGLPIPELPEEPLGGDPYGNLKAAILLFFFGLGFAFGSDIESEMMIPAALLGCLSLAFLLIHLLIPKAALQRKKDTRRDNPPSI